LILDAASKSLPVSDSSLSHVLRQIAGDVIGGKFILASLLDCANRGKVAQKSAYTGWSALVIPVSSRAPDGFHTEKCRLATSLLGDLSHCERSIRIFQGAEKVQIEASLHSCGL
jgi:hypothetical protein